MLPWSHLLHHVYVSLAQPATLLSMLWRTNMQPCAVVSLASTSYSCVVRPNRTPIASAPAAAPSTVHCVCFSCCSPIAPASTCCFSIVSASVASCYFPIAFSSASCCSSSASACYHTHAVQSISTKAARHYCSPDSAPRTSHFRHAHADI